MGVQNSKYLTFDTLNMGKRNEEKDKITDPIKNYFEEKKKSLCIEEFYLPTRYEYKKPDLVVISGWKRKDVSVKWGNDNIPSFDMMAIESKLKGNTRNSIINAIPQALVYQQFFPKVYIACQSGEIGSIKKFLESNGIGCITVNMERKVVEEEKILESIEENNKFNSFIRDNRKNIANKLVVLALGREKFDALEKWDYDDSTGVENRGYGDFQSNEGYGWVAMEKTPAIQWNISIGYGHGDNEPKNMDKVYSGLNIEVPKHHYEKIFRNLEKDEFLKLIRKLPEEYLCWYFKKKKIKGTTKNETNVCKDINKLTSGDIKDIVDYMTGDYGGYFSISRVVWHEGITEKECKGKIDEVEKDLENIFDYLSSCQKITFAR